MKPIALALAGILAASQAVADTHGIASWYSTGRITASGETYDKHQFTAGGLLQPRGYVIWRPRPAAAPPGDRGAGATQATFRPFSTVVGALLLLLVAFDLWAWRLRFLQGWFVPRPDLRGTWRVELQSDWKNPETDEVIDPIVAYLVVRQTFSTLSVRLLTAESASELVAAEITKATDGTYRLAAVYRNEPKLAVRDRSPIHFGAIVLDVQGDPVTGLSGHYWTDRNSRGEIRTLDRNGTIAESFNDAQRLLPLA